MNDFYLICGSLFKGKFVYFIRRCVLDWYSFYIEWIECFFVFIYVFWLVRIIGVFIVYLILEVIINIYWLDFMILVNVILDFGLF